jgi:predicted transcriptional regulator
MTEYRKRITMDLSLRLDNELERLATKTQRSKADIFRIAISYLLFIDKAIDDGMTVGAWKDGKDFRREREFVGLV